MPTIFAFLVSLAVVAGSSSVAFGHGAGFLAVGAPEAIHRELVAIFGPDTAFSATAKVTWTKSDGVYRQEFPYYYRRGVLRLDRDHATNPYLPESHKELHRRQGTDVFVTLVTKESISTIFPRLKAVLRMTAVPDRESAAVVEDLGRETIDGHPSRKRKIVLGDGTSETSVVVWEAEDPQGLPVRIEGTHDDEVTRIDFADVTPDPPADLFEVPKDYEIFERADRMLEKHKPDPAD